jgi:hypothetical protein
MTGTKGVMLAFSARCETGKSAELPQSGELFTPSGEQFVSIGLVPDIPDDFIPRALKNPVQRNGKLDDTKVRGKMSAIRRNDRNKLLPDFRSKLFEFGYRQSPKVAGLLDAIQ